ncbi:hypothetical protein ABK040_006418 [Willaertia magna]
MNEENKRSVKEDTSLVKLSGLSDVKYSNYRSTIEPIQVREFDKKSLPKSTSSPTKHQQNIPSWSKITGGNYNSPRCLDAGHRNINSPHFIRKSSISTPRVVLLQESDSPRIKEKREKLHALYESNKIDKRLPMANTNDSRESSNSKMSTNSEEEIGLEDSLVIEKQRLESAYNRARAPSRENHIPTLDSRKEVGLPYQHSTANTKTSFLPIIKPKMKKSTTATRERIKLDGLGIEGNQFLIKSKNVDEEDKITMAGAIDIQNQLLNFNDFDKKIMLNNFDDKTVNTILNPNIYPTNMKHQVDYFRRRKNMFRNDYQNFNPHRGQKLVTPFVYYRRNTIKKYMEHKHLIEQSLGTQNMTLAPDLLPHHLVRFEDNEEFNYYR